MIFWLKRSPIHIENTSLSVRYTPTSNDHRCLLNKLEITLLCTNSCIDIYSSSARHDSMMMILRLKCVLSYSKNDFIYEWYCNIYNA